MAGLEQSQPERCQKIQPVGMKQIEPVGARQNKPAGLAVLPVPDLIQNLHLPDPGSLAGVMCKVWRPLLRWRARSPLSFPLPSGGGGTGWWEVSTKPSHRFPEALLFLNSSEITLRNLTKRKHQFNLKVSQR